VSHSPIELDRIDLRILDCLQEDGRISNLKLAEKVSLSPTAVLARVQRLTKDGYILGYEATGRVHDGVCRSITGPHHTQCV
jgi:Lrp/AsnC family leucine-responsive transcriptional regulator